MMVELTIRGSSDRLAGAVFDGFEVTTDGSNTFVSGTTRDDIDAVDLIQRATEVGFVVISWRVVEPSE